MPVSPTYPGVYVQEVPSGVRTIVGVSTSIAAFIGRTQYGPLNEPTRVQSYTDFVRLFGEDITVGDMSRYVKLFFLNGGTDCYVTRIAQGALSSSTTLRTEAAAPTAALTLTAKNAGVIGDTIRVGVSYNTPLPESTFNLEIFRWTIDSRGQRVQTGREVWNNLTMNPNAGSYARDVLNQKSNLVSAVDPAAASVINGYSLSGQPIAFTSGNAASFRGAVAAVLGATTPTTPRNLRISVDGNSFVGVTIADDFSNVGTFAGPTVTDLKNQFSAAIKARIESALAAAGILGTTVTVSFEIGPLIALADTPTGSETALLRIRSNASKDILVQSAGTLDAALPLALGQSNGGTEIGAYSLRRPAPTGITLKTGDGNAFNTVVPGVSTVGVMSFASLPQSGGTQVTSVTLDEFDTTGALVGATINLNLADSPVGSRYWTGNSTLRAKLGRWRDQVNAYVPTTPGNVFRWRAEVWGSRLAFIPTAGDDNALPAFATGGTNLATSFTLNRRYNSLGPNATGAFQVAVASGNDGSAPKSSDYDAAYVAIDNEVDLFNLMVLPPDRSPDPSATPSKLWGAASVFCNRRRAFLIMDPEDSWTDASKAANGVNAVRVGLVKDYSAIYFPRLTITEDGRDVNIGAAGAMAGLYARIDGTRGVWKAPAGTEADIRGVVGLDLKLTDGQDGIINPVGVNGLRVFPEGVVSWGARTNDGADAFASEYKYIPIRRLALFIEESLYRGLKWAVFEPNDVGLWSQIRLNVGAFMHNLFRQGAFQGTKPNEAYFVKCDAETTTQNDRNLGIVNIWVGFAPLKPAEFVILYLQQIAGQIET